MYLYVPEGQLIVLDSAIEVSIGCRSDGSWANNQPDYEFYDFVRQVTCFDTLWVL
jgi:hypothetical protein